MTSSVPEPVQSGRQRLHTMWVTLFFIAVTALLTWPQVLVLSTHAVDHHDIYFNLWRLRWIAHALATSPFNLFRGNVFYPEPRALTFSDAMLVEGVIGAPLVWIGLPPMLIHNLLLLGAIVASGVGMYVLARELTGSRGAGIAAGLIFSFVPYRFDHYMHMELQWIMWTPWAFWALHRTFNTGSLRYGLLTGMFVALQMLSSIYYGLFLGTLLGLCALCLVLGAHGRRLSIVKALAAGAAVAAIACALYAIPYLASKQQVGGRSDDEIIRFSARPSSYLVATPDNVVWGQAFASRGRPERRLFPGALALVLAVIGLLLKPPPPSALVYLIGGLAAFEMSLGFSGYSFRFLYDHVPIFQGLRAMARAGIFVVFFVAGLAAVGYAAIASSLRRIPRMVFLVVVVAVLIGEYRVRRMTLFPYPNEAPPLYAWLAQQPSGVVAELPMPVPEALPGPDARYAYFSTFHWHPLLNGYSGFFPASYVERADALRNFPDDSSILRLKRDGAYYLLLHIGAYAPEDREAILETLTQRHRMAELARFGEGPHESLAFLVR
jgi:hypothetical protein